MKRTLLFAAALSAFIVPAVSPVLAQDTPGFRNGDEIRAARRASEATAARAATASTAAERPRQEARQERRAERREERQERRQDRQPRATAPQAPATPAQPVFRNRQDILDARRADERRVRREERQQDRRQERREDRPENREDRREWRQEQREDRQERREDRRERREDRREYREYRQRFNADMWRQNWLRQRGYDWWRHDRAFRGYSGLRLGFYFAPGYGYYQVPRSYWNQRWHEGDYLPSIFWRYRLNDWRTYGLGYPPAGTRWVLVDNSIYLVDEHDGYILDVIRDAWRW